MTERGQYITLLCAQHQKGHLSEKTIRLIVGSVSVSVLKKFKIDADGNYYNERMQLEIDNRLTFIKSRVENGKKGGRKPKLMDNLMDNHTLKLPDNEDVIVNTSKGKEGVGEKPLGYFEQSITDIRWLESVDRAIGQPPEPWVQKFHDHVTATEEFHPTIQKWRQHAVSWAKIEIRKQKQDAERKPKLTGIDRQRANMELAARQWQELTREQSSQDRP